MSSAGRRGRHFRLVVLYAEEQPDRIPALVGELVSRSVDVMVQLGDPAIRAAQQATRAIPIGMADDIVGHQAKRVAILPM